MSQSRLPRVAVLSKGTFSDEAARYFFRDREVELHHRKMIADVFKSTAGGDTDWSVIPIENTIDGSVSLHSDWLVHEVELPIRAEWVFPAVQNLVGSRDELKPDAAAEGQAERVWDPAKIVKIFSHPVAMAQCYEFIRTHVPHAELETLSSTAEAIRTVHEHPGRGWAAIGTRTAAADYGLDLLQEGVTDHDNNYTRFLLVGHPVYACETAPKHKTSVLITLPEDYPGALHQVLAAFSWRRINLSRIESRPTKKRLGSYYFWIDIEMSLDTVLLPAAIAEIEAIGCQVRILGSYPSFPFEG